MEIHESNQNAHQENEQAFIEERRYPSTAGTNFYYYNNLSNNPEQTYSKIKIFNSKEFSIINTNVRASHAFSFNFNFTSIQDWVSQLI